MTRIDLKIIVILLAFVFFLPNAMARGQYYNIDKIKNKKTNIEFVDEAIETSNVPVYTNKNIPIVNIYRIVGEEYCIEGRCATFIQSKKSKLYSFSLSGPKVFISDRIGGRGELYFSICIDYEADCNEFSYYNHMIFPTYIAR